MHTLAALGATFLLAAAPLPTPELTPAARESAPVTDHCPHALAPAEPVSASETLAPGQQAPAPPPVAVEGNCGVSAADGYAVPEELTASAWIVADVDSGEIIAQKDPHGRYRPASIIKVLLTMVAIHELPLDKVHVVSEETASQEGSSVGLGAGGRYTVEQLLHGVLLGSGNDAAHALAQELGGDEATLTKINDYARSLGTVDTLAASYSGLDKAGMSTSAHDLGMMYRAAFTDPVFARIANTDFIDFPGYGDVDGYELWNDNGLLLNDPDGIGGKTGFTDDANHTFVGALDRDGRRLMAVVLDTTLDAGRPWEQAQRLLHAAYDLTPGGGVGELVPVETASPAATPTPDTALAAPADTGSTERGQGVGATAIALLGAAALAAAGAVLLLRRR